MAFLETGAFVGLIAPGETVVIAGGVDGRAGRDPAAPADRARLGLRGAGRHDELLHRPPPRPPLPRAPRPAGEDHPRAARAGGGLLRPPRRQDDPDRPFHRAGPGARAVHRRLVGAALPALHPVQHRRHRPLGHHVLRPRLRLLALVRPGGAPRGPGDLRTRRDGRRDRRPWWSPTGAAATSRLWFVAHRRHPLDSAAVRGRRARCTAGSCVPWSQFVGPVRAVPGRSRDAGWARARAHDAARDRRRRAVRVRRLPHGARPHARADPARQRAARPRATARGRTCWWTWRRSSRTSARSRWWAGSSRPRRCCSRSGAATRRSLVLVAGLVLVYIAVHVTKDAIERPRPTDSLVDTSGEAYPSGHAAYATAWVAAAVALTRRLRLVTSGTLVFAGARDRGGGRAARASTCARTGGRTSPAAGGSAWGSSRRSP